MRRSFIKMAMGSLRGGLCLVLVGGLLLRPAQLDAILIHSHGDEGGHFHPLSRSDIGLYQQEHDRLHELEHADDHAGDAERAIHEHADHSEECGAILVVFGEMKGATASPRFNAAFSDSSPNTAADAVFVANDLLEFVNSTSGTQRACVSAPARSLDAILKSSHALLI